MAVSFQVGVVVFLVLVVRAIDSGGPVASQKQTFDQLENTAASNEQASNEEQLIPTYVSIVAGARTVKGIEKDKSALLPKVYKPRRDHRGNHKTKKHHRKHHRQGHHHERTSHHHLSHASPTSAFPTTSGGLLGLNAQISLAQSFEKQLVPPPLHRYARAGKAKSRKEKKTAKLDKPTPKFTPIISNASELLTRSSLQPTKNTTGAPTTPVDPCALWERCALNQNATLRRWLEELPNCPCQFHPMQLFFNSTLYDQELDKYFEWRVMKVDKLDLLRRTAEFCIRQRRSFSSSSLAAQVCCYDSKLKLITRGVGAGTPFLVSPDWNRRVHYELDELPIRLCNGDWTRYHAVRPPNNDRNCTENPGDEEFAHQVGKARDY